MLEAINYFLKSIPSEMCSWALNTPLILKLSREKLGRNLLYVKINYYLTNSLRRSCSLCSIYKSLLKVTVFVHFYILESPNERISVSSILQYQLLSLRLYLLRDEVCLLLKEGHSKRIGISPAKLLWSSISISSLNQ